jgi:predicted Rdx family selenoprotein
MAEVVITVRVIRKGPRTTQLLSELAQALGRDGLEPDGLGAVDIRMSGRGPRVWEEVRDALDSTGDDWRQWLHLAPRPPR